MTPDPPDAAERLSDAEVTAWAENVESGGWSELASRERRAAFLRDSLILRKRLDDPAIWEAAVDAAGMASQQERTRQMALEGAQAHDFARIREAEAAAIRRTVLGTEEA